MRKLLTILFFILSMTVSATTYYVSTTGSNDTNNGTSPSTPWETLTKVNSFTFSPGDNILFNRGSGWYGSLVISNSGTAGNPITYGAYGTGANPVISGFTNVSSWINLGSNIWESTSAVSTLSTCNMVVINRVNTAMGRFPNTGYLRINAISGDSTLTNGSLYGTNWAGASIAIKKQRWYIEVGTILSQVDSTVKYTDPNLFQAAVGWGFFIENDSLTLDQQNEWYYNPSTKKLRIYSTSMPANVQLTTIENTFDNSANCKYITIDSLSFTGANTSLMNCNYGQNISILNCNLSYGGIRAIYINGLVPTITGNIINTVGYEGIYSQQNGIGGNISYNNIKDVCLIPGTAVGAGGGAIFSVAAHTILQYNVIDSSGWGGLLFYGDSSYARHNFINHSCLTRDDTGGLATHGGYTGQEITDNIVLNSIGTPDGTNSISYLAQGIYLDDLTDSVLVQNNSVANCTGAGLFLHRIRNITILNNTLYNNSTDNTNFIKGQMMFQLVQNDPAFYGMNIKHNIFFSKTNTQLCFYFYLTTTDTTNFQTWGVSDSNYYARPIDSTNIIMRPSNINYTLGQWKTYSTKETHSKGSPKTITDVNDLVFEYNATTSSQTIALDAVYEDVAGTSYNGSITLAPFTSAVLIKTGIAPIVNAGGNFKYTGILNFK